MSTVTIITGGSRLPRANEEALNILLARAVSFNGLPLYRISWAVDDAQGLEKHHGLGCPKSNPMDWNCTCPLANPNQLPLCFEENQASYHLLVREMPSYGLDKMESEVANKGFEKPDFSRGSWACVMHFIDPKTNIPIDPTASVIERIIPTLRAAQEANRLAQIGASSLLASMRARRKNALLEREERKQKAAVEKSVEMLDDAASAFGGKPWSGGHGEKTKHSSEIVLTDLT